MKKTIFYSFLILVCISFFSVQNYDAGKNSSTDNSSQTLSNGWEMKLAPDTEKFVNVFFQSENLGCIYKGFQPLKRTTNGGDTWGYGTVPPYVTINNHTYFSGSYLIITAQQDLGTQYIAYMYKSTDMGLSWEIFHSITGFPPVYYNIYCLYKNVGYLTVMPAAAPNTFRTKSGFDGWSWIEVGGRTMAWQVSYIDTAVVYGNCGDCIGRCVHWAYTFDLIKNGSYSKVCVVDSNNILAIGRAMLLRSTNAGANWDSTSFLARLNSISFPDQNTGYITGSNGKIYKSTDKGATWYIQVTPTTDSLVDCCFLNNLTGYVIGYNGTLLKTTDGGGSMGFTVSGTVRYEDNNQLITSGSVKAFRLNTQTNQIMILDSSGIQPDGSYILNHVPQGESYIGAVPNSSPPADYVLTYYPSAIYYRDATVLNPTGNMTGIDIRAFRMSQVTTSNSVNGKVNSSAPVSPLKDANVYAKSGSTFVGYKTTGSDGIYHINSVPTGTLKIIADRIGYRSDSTTVTITRNNIDSVNFYLTKLTTGANPISNNVPDKYLLYQNYPNPFNPSTNIKYQITDNNFVTLKVFDILGKEVATLVNENLKAGEYEVTFNGSGLPSGIYFYKLNTENFFETKRMILIK
jgi:hypothetical protein